MAKALKLTVAGVREVSREVREGSKEGWSAGAVFPSVAMEETSSLASVRNLWDTAKSASGQFGPAQRRF